MFGQEVICGFGSIVMTDLRLSDLLKQATLAVHFECHIVAHLDYVLGLVDDEVRSCRDEVQLIVGHQRGNLHDHVS